MGGVMNVKMAVAVSACVVLAGCGSSSGGEARKELAGLPSLEDTKTQLNGALDQIEKSVRALMPKAIWDNGGNETTTSCNSPYSDTDGKKWFAPNRVVPEVPIKADKWAKIQAAAQQASARIGATEVEVARDLITNRDVWFRGPAGLAIEVAYQGNLVISGTTGCRLPA